MYFYFCVCYTIYFLVVLHLGILFLFISCECVIPQLHHCYICVCINIFVNVIFMVTEICLCTSYKPLLGCAKSWESCCAYFLCMIFYSIVVILVDLNSQEWINILLFELVVTWIEANIFVPSGSISHIFISIIKLFCCFLLLGQLLTWNLQHSKTHIPIDIFRKEHLWYFTDILHWWRCFMLIDCKEVTNFNQFWILVQNSGWYLPHSLCWRCVCCEITIIWFHQW